MKHGLNKSEKLKSQKSIEQLFENGLYVSCYPLRLVYEETKIKDAKTSKVAVSVSKRNFKLAVDRNRIKRLLRESYRLNSAEYFNNISTQYAFMILYIGKEMPTYSEVEMSMNGVFNKFLNAITS